MTNIDFLNTINAQIYMNNDTKNYYIYISFVVPNNNESYIDKYLNNGIFIKLTDDIINDVISLEEHINNFDIEDELYVKNVNINDFESIQSTNYKYYTKLNNLLEVEIGENDILNFYQLFMSTILQYSNIQNEELLKNQIYKKVIEYYANGQTDNTLTGLKLILKGVAVNYIDTSELTSCGCNQSIIESNTTVNNSGVITTGDCVTAYTESMYLYLVQMFKDIDFYYDFMFNDNEPNENLINSLYNLIEYLKGMDFSLDFNNNKDNHCYCEDLTVKNTNNYNILNNFQKVLQWVNECKIVENTNKIKIYGEQFAQLLPNLQF
jgi:hypothetical protein